MQQYGGPERRTCSVPCKPIADKLAIIEACSRKKVSMKLFLALVGFVVIGIGGMQWNIVDRIGTIDTNLAVLAATVTETRDDLIKHDRETSGMETRIRNLELRESSRHPEYFNFLDKKYKDKGE